MIEFDEQQTRQWLSGLERRVSSAAVALYTDDDRVLVVKANYKKYWSFPGGIIDLGETPKTSAVREVREETGIELNISDVEFKMVVDRVSEIAQTYQFVFQARVDSNNFESIVISETEIDEYAIVSRQQIIANDRYYSQSTLLWAQGSTGYHEQIFGAGASQQDI